MMKGAKPLPTKIKELKGTLRADRSNPDEPEVTPLAELPAAPDWLNEWAKDEWYTVVAWLHSVGLLSSVDVSIIAAYCQQMGIYRESENELEAGGRVITTDKGYEMPSAWVAIGNKALMLAMKIATEYGFTPSSRSRITMPGKKKAQSKLEKLKSKS